jgi:hypothetical protein
MRRRRSAYLAVLIVTGIGVTAAFALSGGGDPPLLPERVVSSRGVTIDVSGSVRETHGWCMRLATPAEEDTPFDSEHCADRSPRGAFAGTLRVECQAREMYVYGAVDPGVRAIEVVGSGASAHEGTLLRLTGRSYRFGIVSAPAANSLRLKLSQGRGRPVKSIALLDAGSLCRTEPTGSASAPLEG